jgi:quercetin 2,3-dioxygenase
MITLRKAEDRRRRKRGIHDSWMAFDPENRVDPLRHGFHALESLDEESLGPGMRLRAHPRKDIEILTYVHEGVLILQDEAGQLGRQGPGEFQYMSASPAVRHRALNGSSSDTAHVYQSRMTPSLVEVHPVPEQRIFPTADREGILRLVVSRDGGGMSLRSRQDVRLYSSILLQGHHLVHELEGGRCAWLHVVKGTVVIRDLELRAGDAAAFDGETAVSFTAQEPAEILLFDLA